MELLSTEDDLFSAAADEFARGGEDGDSEVGGEEMKSRKKQDRLRPVSRLLLGLVFGPSFCFYGCKRRMNEIHVCYSKIT